MGLRSSIQSPKGRTMWLSWIMLVLIAEKVAQHGLSALFFSVDISGIGTPDIGSRIPLANPIMSALNLLLMFLFAFGFWEVWNKKRGGLYLIVYLCLFDIIAEFLFHGIVLITVSIIVSAILICLATLQLRRTPIAAVRLH